MGKYPYKKKKVKGKKGECPTDKRGNPVDDKGNSWVWDPKKKEWDVQIDGGKYHLNIDRHGNLRIPVPTLPRTFLRVSLLLSVWSL